MNALECPNCGSPVSELQQDRRRRCAHCGTIFALPQEPQAARPPAHEPPPGLQSASVSSSTLIVNGRTYTSVDEMPPEARAAYDQMMGVFADKDANGVPDILEGAAAMREVAEGLRKQTIVAGTPVVITPRAQAIAENRNTLRGCITLAVLAVVTAVILGATAWAWLPLLP